MTILSIFESISYPVFVAGLDGRTLETNAAFDRVFGSPPESGTIFDRWPELETVWQSALQSITSGRTLQIDIPSSDASGNRIVFDVRLFSFSRPDSGLSPTSNSPTGDRLDGETAGMLMGVAAVCMDATRDRERTRQLELRATTDDLTGVFSRNQLYVLLDLEIRGAVRRKSTGCFIYLDIDGFKQMNDRFGHAEGDRLLKEVATVLKSNLRAADVVARLGGDEFGVILVDAGLENGIKKARQLIGVLNKVVTNGDTPDDAASVTGRQISVSIGVAAFPDDDCDASKIIDRADQAMYRAKRKTENRVVAWLAGDSI